MIPEASATSKSDWSVYGVVFNRELFHLLKQGKRPFNTPLDVDWLNRSAMLRRLTATKQFTEGVPPDLVGQMIIKFCVDHPER